jgi:hypothetical protein
LATALSLAPPVLAWAGGRELAVEGASQLALALLPWIALAGTPQAGSSPGGALATAALALPSLALGAALDVRGGAAPSQVALAGAVGISCCALLAHASQRASLSTARQRAAHAALWTALVALAPALALAVELGRGPRAAPGWLGVVARSSPVGWAAASVVEIDLKAAWRALGACAVLALAFARAPRVESEP